MTHINTYDLLKRFPSIKDTIFHWDNFYIIVDVIISDSKKVAIYKNWVEQLVLFDELIQFTKYNYLSFPTFSVGKMNNQYYYMINDKIYWPYNNKIIGWELLQNNNLYIIQENNNWSQNLLLNWKMDKSNLEDISVISERFDNEYILIKYKENEKYIVLNNWTKVLETDKKIKEIWFEEVNIPYCIFEDDTKNILELPKQDGLI